jgi:hypothetical protein
MKLIETAHPFYRKAWRRWLIVGICMAWTAFEIGMNDPMWIMIAGALTAYAFWVLVWTFPKAPGDD